MVSSGSIIKFSGAALCAALLLLLPVLALSAAPSGVILTNRLAIEKVAPQMWLVSPAPPGKAVVDQNSAPSAAGDAHVSVLSQNARRLLRQSWKDYKSRFIQRDGRVIDPSAGNITTSEGQSYAMLRAAWAGDKSTFDRCRKWTKENLFQLETGLYAWKWGRLGDGSLGVLDRNSATDADQDIAFALIVAGTRWNSPELLNEARTIVRNIWNRAVLQIGGRTYLMPGEWAMRMDKPRLNPSYFAPYIYRVFAQLDREHDWLAVVDTSYSVLERCSALSAVGMPPDWCEIDYWSGEVSLPAGRQSDHSYDAMRVSWRIAMDLKWNAEPRARRYLDSLRFLQEAWQKDGALYGAYTSTGSPRSLERPLAGYGCVLPWFQMSAPKCLPELIKMCTTPSAWTKNDYYGHNWAWFGLAAVNGDLLPPKVIL